MRTHAILDYLSRQKKAKKIEALITQVGSLKLGRVLEVGCGAGYITDHFSRLGYGLSGAYGIDISDERQVTDSFQFQTVGDVKIPFPNEYFDLVISNHVIEHVGSPENQAGHVAEIYRVLEKSGILYLAVPNKWRIVEPHYRLPFLSWLPQTLATRWLRYLKKADEYDCVPLSAQHAKLILEQAGFSVRDVTLSAIRVAGEIESTSAVVKMATRMPEWCWWLLSPIMPTLIFICRKPAD